MNTSKVRIALADDEADARRMLTRLLTTLGYEVACAAENGAKLLDFSSVHEVDVVLLDLDMPGLDGLATAEELTRQGVPVVLISGHPDLHEVVMENEPLVTALKKPVAVATLREAVQLALGSR